MTNNRRNNSVSLISHNVRWCSGACSYCHASNEIQGIDYTDDESIIRSLKEVDDRTYQEFKADYGKLEKLLDNHGIDYSKPLHVGYWGADPVGSLQVLEENVEFMEWYAEKHNLKLNQTTSTNGLGFLRPETLEFMKKHNITTQLSHDGLGQWFRTRQFDPLKHEAVREAFRERVIRHINSVQNFWNADIEKNIDYFNNALVGLPDSINVQMVFTREADYDLTDQNTIGLLNGDIIDELKGVPWGDMSIRNDWELAKKYGVWQLAHQADLYFNQLEMIFRNLGNPRYAHFCHPFYRRIAINGSTVTRDSMKNRSYCSGYALGLIDKSFVLDTTGVYSECHVIDSDFHVEDPKLEGQEWCKTCPYRDRHLCFECGCLKKRSKGCQFLYRYNQLFDRINRQPNLKKYIVSVGKAREEQQRCKAR